MSAAHRTSSATRRSLLTATAAGTLLGALWFVPSANATVDRPAGHTATITTMSGTSSPTPVTSEDTAGTAATGSGTTATGSGKELADTGSFDTTPYVVGGVLFLGLGAGFVTYSFRKERLDLG